MMEEFNFFPVKESMVHDTQLCILFKPAGPWQGRPTGPLHTLTGSVKKKKSLESRHV